ncbi:MarR family winged helix-turn-helix transcriptional regulator [Streptomyces sp. NPDC058308]|uniref:MarR family winged helix-turn-helix transcriptional regulator n=1 Tax=Streptomyces sp. NPDC058308 TaxID=3346440 RepID=UPI0036E8FC2C
MDREGDPLYELTEETAAAVETLVSLWARASRAATPRLSALQLEALLITRRSPGINLTGLAVEVGATLPAVSRLCDRLEAAGLLCREPAPTSRREIGLALTQQGTDVINALLVRRSQLFGDVLSRMPTAARRHFLAGLQEFSDAARERHPQRQRSELTSDGGGPPGMDGG